MLIPEAPPRFKALVNALRGYTQENRRRDRRYLDEQWLADRNFVPYYAIMAADVDVARCGTTALGPLKLQEIATRIQCSRRFGKCIVDAKLHLVVSVHPLCQDIP